MAFYFLDTYENCGILTLLEATVGCQFRPDCHQPIIGEDSPARVGKSSPNYFGAGMSIVEQIAKVREADKAYSEFRRDNGDDSDDLWNKKAAARRALRDQIYKDLGVNTDELRALCAG